MLGEALAGLASAGGSALVTAMVTDGWESVRARFARLLGRGDAARVTAAENQLERSRSALAELSGAELEQARTEQEIAWRTRLGDLLEIHPQAEAELRALVAEIQAQIVGSAGGVEQHMTAFNQAQQAAQGHGVQINTFGGQGEPDATR